MAYVGLEPLWTKESLSLRRPAGDKESNGVKWPNLKNEKELNN